ncbi:hypothetical protein X566_18000 [Afipia sp. P52-10]|nr:hypothetical protein X566_18000 [Afipia sp. P52-10]
MLNQLGSGHDTSRMMHQISKQPIFMRRQLNWIAVNTYSPCPRIKSNRATGKLALGVTSSSPDKGTNARQDLLDVKRFSNIIIRAGIKALDFVAPSVTRRQDQDRRGFAGTTPSF